MMLHLRVQQAISLKRIVEVISGISQIGRLTIQEHMLFIQVMNPEHRVPVALGLVASWFHSYNLVTPIDDSCDSSSIRSNWAIVIDLEELNSILCWAKDDEALEIYIMLDNTKDFNGFYLLFDSQRSLLHFYEMEFTRDTDFDFLTYWLNMEHNYGLGFSATIPGKRFLNVLEHSMIHQRTVNFDITSSMVMVYSGTAAHFLDEGPRCEIVNFPMNGFYSIKLNLYEAEYFIEAARIGNHVGIAVPNPMLTPELNPVLSVAIEKFAIIHFSLPQDCIVDPQVTKHPDIGSSS